MIIVRRSLPDNTDSSSGLSSPITSYSSFPTSTSSTSQSRSATLTYSSRSITTVTATTNASQTPGSTAAAVPATSNRPLSNTAIIAIIVGIVVCVMVSLAMAILAFRLRRKNKRQSSRSALFSRKMGHHKSESSETLTSFDTVTDGGRRGGSRSPPMEREVVVEDLEKLVSVQPFLMPGMSEVNQSTISLPTFPPATLQWPLTQPISHERGSSDPTDLNIQPTKPRASHKITAPILNRAQTFQTLPTLTTSLPPPFLHARSISETATPRHQRFANVSNYPPKPASITELALIPMSSTLSPAHDSPHSLASLDTPALTRSISRSSKGRRRANTGSSTASPLSGRSRGRTGTLPGSAKSTTMSMNYLESKPLPPSPPGPPAPPPPFPPPVTPLSQPPKKSVPIRGTRSDTNTTQKTVKTPTDSKTNTFQELHKRNTSESKSTSQPQSKQNTHISSLARPSFGDLPLPSPKPILKLDISNASKKSIEPPMPFVNAPSARKVNPSIPAYTMKSALADPTNRNGYPFNGAMMAAGLSSLSLPTSAPGSSRPLSNAATVASSRAPLSPTGPFELADERDERRDSLEPLPLNLASRIQSSFLSRTTTMRSSKLNTPSSASFLSIDPMDTPGLPKPALLTRSPSISVPIVFRFRMSRGKSLKQSEKIPVYST